MIEVIVGIGTSTLFVEDTTPVVAFQIKYIAELLQRLGEFPQPGGAIILCRNLLVIIND